MPAARATSSVLVPSKPCLANSATATRSTSARRSSALIRTAGVITRYIVSDDSLPVKQICLSAVGLEQTAVGLGGLFVAVVGVAVVVAAVAVLPAGQRIAERQQPAGHSAFPRGGAQREGELQVSVAIEPRLRVRPAGSQRHVAPHREQVPEQYVDVAGAGIAHQSPFLVAVDVRAAPTGTNDVRIATDGVNQGRDGISGQHRRQVTPHVHRRGVSSQQRTARLPPSDRPTAPRSSSRQMPFLEPVTRELVQRVTRAIDVAEVEGLYDDI